MGQYSSKNGALASHLSTEACSNRNITWQYMHAGDSTVPEPYSKCKNLNKALQASNCKRGKCIGRQGDRNFLRYQFRRWDGLGSPLPALANFTDSSITDVEVPDKVTTNFLDDTRTQVTDLYGTKIPSRVSKRSLPPKQLPNLASLSASRWSNDVEAHDDMVLKAKVSPQPPHYETPEEEVEQVKEGASVRADDMDFDPVRKVDEQEVRKERSYRNSSGRKASATDIHLQRLNEHAAKGQDSQGLLDSERDMETSHHHPSHYQHQGDHLLYDHNALETPHPTTNQQQQQLSKPTPLLDGAATISQDMSSLPSTSTKSKTTILLPILSIIFILFGFFILALLFRRRQSRRKVQKTWWRHGQAFTYDVDNVGIELRATVAGAGIGNSGGGNLGGGDRGRGFIRIGSRKRGGHSRNDGIARRSDDLVILEHVEYVPRERYTDV